MAKLGLALTRPGVAARQVELSENRAGARLGGPRQLRLDIRVDLFENSIR